MKAKIRTKKTKKNKSQAQQAGLVGTVNRLAKKFDQAFLGNSGTPFGTTGATIGSMFGPLGTTVGRFLGSGIGSIFGSGDYKMGPSSRYNVLTNQNQIPKFASSKYAHTVCHREYIGDISGTSAFTLRSYNINPGLAKTFPWLSTLAANYEEYKIHGMIFEYRSTSAEWNGSTQALGTVILATEYNSTRPSFANKIAMENHEYAVSGKPSANILHGIECARNQSALSEQYVRQGYNLFPSGSTGDQRFADFGEFQLATQGFTGTPVVGELWVSYCIELLKPRFTPIGGNTCHYACTGVAMPSNLFGTANSLATGAVANAFSQSQTLSGSTWTCTSAVPGRYYKIDIWIDGTAVTANFPDPTTLVGCSLVNDFMSATQSSAVAPQDGILSDTKYALTTCVTPNADTETFSVLFAGSGSVPGGTADVFITLLDTL